MGGAPDDRRQLRVPLAWRLRHPFDGNADSPLQIIAGIRFRGHPRWDVDMTFADAGGTSGTSSISVLLVEDSETVRMLTAEYLRSMGCDVVDVDAAEEALDLLLAGESFDVLFTDQSLPGMSGMDLARRVRNAYPRMHLIISSGFDQVPDLADLLPRVRFLPKPYDLASLDRALSVVSRG
jgi:CheY-like chemotaxis protein